MGERIRLLFALLADLGNKSGAAPITKFEGCWEKQIDDKWWIALNGHREPVKCSHGQEVPPIHCYVEWLGWPAGLVNPFEGTLVAHPNANEDGLIEALRTAGAECKEESPPLTTGGAG